MVFDAVFGIVVLWYLFRGYRAGFAYQALSIAGLVIAAVYAEPVAKILFPMVEPSMGSLPESVRLPTLFFAVLLGMWFGIVIAGGMVLFWIRRAYLGYPAPSGADRVCGMGVGLLKAALVISILVFVANRLPEDLRNAEAFQKQYETSRGVELANRFPIFEKILGTDEAKRIHEYLGQAILFVRGETERPPTLRPED